MTSAPFASCFSVRSEVMNVNHTPLACRAVRSSPASGDVGVRARPSALDFGGRWPQSENPISMADTKPRRGRKHSLRKRVQCAAVNRRADRQGPEGGPGQGRPLVDLPPDTRRLLCKARPRTKPAMTRDSRALVLVTPTPSSREAKSLVGIAQLGALQLDGAQGGLDGHRRPVPVAISGLGGLASLAPIAAQPLGDLGVQGGLHQQANAQAGNLLEDDAELLARGEEVGDLATDVLGGGYSSRHGRWFLHGSFEVPWSLAPVRPLHHLVDATAPSSDTAAVASAPLCSW